jgi:hypothetical protein
MKRFVALGALVLLGSSTAFAALFPSRYILQGIDIYPVAQYLGKEIVTLKTPLYLYNWSKSARLAESGAKGLAESWAQAFWGNYSSGSGGGNEYGYGLYGAVDPVTSRYFGGMTNNDWLLTEMRIPTGFRIMDLESSDNRPPTPQNIIAITDRFNCPKSLDLHDFFKGGGSELTPKCRTLVEMIYKNILKLQGVAYYYDAAGFKDCSPPATKGLRAFVIMDSSWITAKSVRYYSPKTKDYLEGRLRIQSLFLKLESESSDTSKPPAGPVITAQEATMLVQNKLLWPDLEGMQKTPHIGAWIKENLYMCSGLAPF